MPLLSLVHRYTARPEPVVKNVPADDEEVVMTVEPEPPLEDDAPLGELLDAAPALLHAATSSAAPTAPPAPVASRAFVDIRFAIEILTAFLSSLAQPGCAKLRFQTTVATGTSLGFVGDWLRRADDV